MRFVTEGNKPASYLDGVKLGAFAKVGTQPEFVENGKFDLFFYVRDRRADMIGGNDESRNWNLNGWLKNVRSRKSCLPFLICLFFFPMNNCFVLRKYLIRQGLKESGKQEASYSPYLRRALYPMGKKPN